MEDEKIINTSDIIEEIRRLRENDIKWQGLKTRYHDVGIQLETVAKSLMDIAREIDPTGSLDKPFVGRRGPRVNSMANQVREWAFKQMKVGLQVGSDALLKEFPNMPVNMLSQYLQTVAKIPGVDKRKEGVKVFYFLR